MPIPQEYDLETRFFQKTGFLIDNLRPVDKETNYYIRNLLLKKSCAIAKTEESE
ncbi:hypothetical protein [Microseira wollei]|uniref:Uncharacterized protein n=1 Tax=Microseira wollei NIES-4236 TaxID=2530354 RepID=A0AAV3XF49_9CYAN|nr:hypothetical protein [Microseira wollei]GET38052.1 hypothetical protein MiSe_28060 [Microseira wollei NIES-4236]